MWYIWLIYKGEYDDDLDTFLYAIKDENSLYWLEVMKEKIGSMDKNYVRKLVDLSERVWPLDCKWIFKMKRDPIGKVEWYKARLVAKELIQRKGIDF